MAKQTFIRWFGLLTRKQDSPHHRKFKVFIISDSSSPEQVPPLLKKYFPLFETGKTLKNFSLVELLSGKYKFSGHPNKKNLSFTEKIKRGIVRIFYTNYGKVAAIWNLVDLIFLPSAPRNFFTPSAHVVDIYKTHLSGFSVKELSSYLNPSRNFIIFLLALISRRHFIDKEDGLTVFANMASPWLLMAYKFLHPNKSVYLRFHDGLEHMTERKNFLKFRKSLHQLIDKKIIQGAESYYEPDAEFLGITYRPNAVNSNVMQKVNYNYRKFIYTFIGAYKSVDDQSRLHDLNRIREQLHYLYPEIRKYINEYIIFVQDFDKERIIYSQYLKLVGESEIIIDMYRLTTDEGLSFRISEALLLGRKIITNRLIVLNYDFYDPSRFFVIGHDLIDRLEEFIKGEFKPLSPEIRKRYDCSYWWKNTDMPEKTVYRKTIH